MKAKLNLNGAAIKNFFVNNGEKIVLVATVLLLFSFAYGAITATPIDSNKPNEIKQASTAAQQRVNETPWEEAWKTKPDLRPQQYQPKVEEGVKPLGEIARLEQAAPWDAPPFKSRGKRPDPKILAVRELVGTGVAAIVPYQPDEVAAAAPVAPGPPRRRDEESKAGKAKTGGKTNPRDNLGKGGSEGRLLGGPTRGMTRARGAKGEEETTKDLAADRPIGGYPVPGSHALGAKPVPRYMAVVTGIVPFAEQYKEYKDKFEDALGIDAAAAAAGGDHFTPSYILFRIQRAEVKDQREVVLDAAWKVLDITAGWDDWKNWFQANNQNDPPIDPNYSFAAQSQQANDYVKWLEWPLPPTYLRNWGFEVTHPKVPFMKPEIVETMDENQLVNPLDPNGGTMPQGGAAPAPRAGGPGMGMGGRPGFGGPRGGVMGGGDMMRGGGRMMGGMGSRGMRPGPNGEMTGAPAAPYKLYRYVDMTCERGKRYRYRVQLVLNNPNYMFPAGILEKPDSANKQYVDSAWSEPSAMVEIPMDAQVLASNVAPQGSEPEAQVNLLAMSKWKKEEKKKPTAAAGGDSDIFGGGIGMTNMEPTEGYVAVLKNFKIPLGGVAYFANEKVKKVLDMVVEIEKKEVEGLTFNANGAMLLDMRGDDALGNVKAKGPTEMIFFDKSGRLISANSAVDYHVTEDYKDRTFLPDDLTGVGVGGGMMGIGGPRGMDMGRER